jgi:acyl carrier protein
MKRSTPVNIEETVTRIIARENHLDPTSVTLDSTFAELGIDSLDGINIVFALESEMNIAIPDAVARNMTSVRQVVDGLTRVIEGKDISDLVALAQQSVAVQQASPAA